MGQPMNNAFFTVKFQGYSIKVSRVLAVVPATNGIGVEISVLKESRFASWREQWHIRDIVQ